MCLRWCCFVILPRSIFSVWNACPDWDKSSSLNSQYVFHILGDMERKKLSSFLGHLRRKMVSNEEGN
jgi:hypothetical protein